MIAIDKGRYIRMAESGVAFCVFRYSANADSNKEPYPNILADVGLEYCVIHNLRKTCRSLLAELQVPPHIAQRCLNHNHKGVEGVYDKYDYLDERTDTLDNLANRLIKLLG